MNSYWTDSSVQMLCSLWRGGYTGQQIANHFKISRSKVLGKASRLGLLGKMSREERTRRQIAGEAHRRREAA